MKIVIDSNILFSALIKNSATRNIILNYKGCFLFPSYIFFEMQKHKEQLLKKSKLKENEFNFLLEVLLEKFMIIPNEVLLKHKKEAIETVRDIDVNDAVFIAAALAYKCMIWSDDKKLKKQNKVRILNTKEIIEIIC